jgi:signal transduction histidine kinase
MLSRWRGASLRVHLLVEFGLAFGLILLAFLYVGVQALNSSTALALEERVVVAQLMAERIDGHLSRARETIHAALADASIELQDENPVPERELVQSLYDRSALFKRIVLMDASGIVLWTAPYTETMIGINMSDPPYNVRLAFAAEPSFAVNIGRNTQKPGVAIVHPIVSSHGGIAGYLSGWIDLSDPRATPLLFPYAPGGAGYSDLVDDQGLVLMSTSPERVGQISDHAGHFGELVEVKETNVGTCHSCHDAEGAGRENDVLAFAPLSQVPWGVALHQPEAEVFDATNSLSSRLWLVGLVVLAVFLAMVSITTRQIIGPLLGLTQASRDIAAGDLSHPMPAGGVAETASLARSFETMRQDLLGYRQRMEAAQQGLEQRVEERTAELVLARDYLLKTNRNLTALNVIGATLGQSLDLTETLNVALGRTLEAIVTPVGGIFLRGREQPLALVAHQGLPTDSQALLDNVPSFDPSSGATTEEEITWLDVCQRLLTTALGGDSVLCVPLEGKGSVLGLLFAADLGQRHFTPEERTLLSSIAWQIAMAVRNAHLYDALQQQDQMRAGLLHQVIAAQEDERKRIARELHDETSQAITALLLGLHTTGLALESNPQEAFSRLDATKGIAETMLENIHRLTSDLRPSLLDDLGLVPAITWYCEQRLQPAGIAFQIQSEGLKQRLPSPLETALFRIVQEAVTNVIRHAGATRVTMSLSLRHGQVVLRVADNGRGSDPRALRANKSYGNGLGLRGMEERVSILGGEFQIATAPGQGMIITVTVPVPGPGTGPGSAHLSATEAIDG